MNCEGDCASSVFSHFLASSRMPRMTNSRTAPLQYARLRRNPPHAPFDYDAPSKRRFQ